MTAAADVIERVAAAELSDPATDDLTVPLAVQLAEASARLSRLEAALREAREALRPFACLCAEIQSLADANHNSPHEWAKICAWPDLQKAHHAAVAIDAALAPAAPAEQDEGGER